MVSYRSLLHEHLGFAMQFGKCVNKFCVKHMVHAGTIMQLSSSIEVATQEMSSNLYPPQQEKLYDLLYMVALVAGWCPRITTVMASENPEQSLGCTFDLLL